MRRMKLKHRHVLICLRNPCPDSQPELLEGLHGVQRRAGVPLQDLHLVSVPHQRAADYLIQQGLLCEVHRVAIFSPDFIFTGLRRLVAYIWEQPNAR